MEGGGREWGMWWEGREDGKEGVSFNLLLLFFRMKELIGFSTDDFIGTRLRDYFHPADYTKLIPCEVMCKSHIAVDYTCKITIDSCTCVHH